MNGPSEAAGKLTLSQDMKPQQRCDSGAAIYRQFLELHADTDVILTHVSSLHFSAFRLKLIFLLLLYFELPRNNHVYITNIKVFI
jgi:hypothetical protein